ncbi:hypothetical protein [Desulfitobacterium sp. AusDCA]|uniref:hypothetical protein n=1 Tax=Desulfitobacterium sp. AusDCA TaxID=3240383 RepID=UPI003DA6F9BD
MNAFFLGIQQNNKLFFIILLALLSILSVYMPHGCIAPYEHHDDKCLFKQVANSFKPIMKLRKILKKFETFLLRDKKILWAVPARIKGQYVLFNLLFFKVVTLQLCPFLYGYFSKGKYKELIY